jgi:ABC-type transporter Mla MlaB component
MTIRVQVKSEGSTTVVALEGRLTSDFVGEIVQQLKSTEGRLALDLSELKWADEEGVAAIREAAAEGAVVRGASPFVRLLLEDESRVD